MAFNRDRNNSRPGGGFRPRFNDRGPNRGPVEMHDAICDNCGKSCQVPFRPTSGKPIFCSSCFENQRGGSERRSEERQMFSAVCADCGDNCQVPFRPSSDKPVFCSNCFGGKKNAGGNAGGKLNFEEINAKLDKILMLLSNTPKEIISETPVEFATVEVPEEIKIPKKKSKSAKKSPKA